MSLTCRSRRRNTPSAEVGITVPGVATRPQKQVNKLPGGSVGLLPVFQFADQILQTRKLTFESDADVVVRTVGAGGHANNSHSFVDNTDRRRKLDAQMNALMQPQFKIRLLEHADEHAAGTDVLDGSTQWRILRPEVKRRGGGGT